MNQVQNNLNIVALSPPTILPTIYVAVNVGQTINITRAIIDAAMPYHQPQDAPLGSFYMQNYEGDFEVLMAENNTPSTIAYFRNGGARLYAISQGGGIFNSYVPYNVINNNAFTITGIKVGQSTVTYTASAHNGTHESLPTTDILGRIVVKVVSTVNNKPTNLSGGTQDVVIGNITTIEGATVTYQYVDPEGDPVGNVMIMGLPTKGTILYLGAPVTMNQIIPYQHIVSGMLTYWNDANLSQIGQTDTFSHTVSDTGSGEFY